jgi:hypothetical protein
VGGVRTRAYAWAHAALIIRQATRRRIICDLSGSTKFFDIISQTARFLGKNKFTEHKTRVLVLSTTFI